MESIKTRAYGEIQVPDNSAIHFQKGILGFEDLLDYYLLEMKDLENFYWLQSGDNQDLAFIVVDPRIFVPDYRLDVDESDLELIEREEQEDIIDFVIANVPEDPSKMSVNLLGPILINAAKRLAIQTISNVSEYGTKHLVFQNQNEEVAV